MGIAEAIATALEVAVAKDLWGQTIRIFTDAETCVENIGVLVGKLSYDKGESFNMSYMSPIIDKIVEMADKLDDRDCYIEMRWVKRGQVGPQKMADGVCRVARESSSWVNPAASPGIAELDERVFGAVRGFFWRQWIMYLDARDLEESG
ncbi:hypothetical protein QBC34DRAFT_378604 [Podospora aff. communis PSN243]|uniref:RNase H type-1 domain-containing protein n=1 Tax=Podospora aff. communis PSN243 TaxID=3040156 RepID=A0AAV9GR45_9PEZI|nr:hypothetical protein QBC34DRAFT_378604 [Podospora aff. communis PSN243]